MSRDLSSTITTEIESDSVRPFFAVELLFDSPNQLRFWTGYGDLVYNGNTYIGSGNLLAISRVEETAELAVRGATLTLSGVSPQIISLALQTPYQGRVCNIYFGLFDKAVNDVSSDNLTQIFSGYMDQMNISEEPDTATVELSVENKLIDLERPRVRRYTSAFQRSLYPNDRGLDFVDDIQGRKFLWAPRGG